MKNEQLSPLERLAVAGLWKRQQNLQSEQERLAQDWETVLISAADRLGLEHSVLRTKYLLDPENGLLVPIGEDKNV